MGAEWRGARIRAQPGEELSRSGKDLRPLPFKTSGLAAVWTNHSQFTTSSQAGWSPSPTVRRHTRGTTFTSYPAVLQAREIFVLPVLIQDSWEPAIPGGGRLVIRSRVTGIDKESVHLEGANGNGLLRPLMC